MKKEENKKYDTITRIIGFISIPVIIVMYLAEGLSGLNSGGGGTIWGDSLYELAYLFVLSLLIIFKPKIFLIWMLLFLVLVFQIIYGIFYEEKQKRDNIRNNEIHAEALRLLDVGYCDTINALSTLYNKKGSIAYCRLKVSKVITPVSLSNLTDYEKKYCNIGTCMSVYEELMPEISQIIRSSVDLKSYSDSTVPSIGKTIFEGAKYSNETFITDQNASERLKTNKTTTLNSLGKAFVESGVIGGVNYAIDGGYSVPIDDYTLHILLASDGWGGRHYKPVHNIPGNILIQKNGIGVYVFRGSVFAYTNFKYFIQNKNIVINDLKNILDEL